MALSIHVHERILNESVIELRHITDKAEIQPMLGYIRKTLDDGYKAANLNGWVGPSSDKRLLENLSEVRIAVADGQNAALAVYEDRLGGHKLTGITGIRSNPLYRDGVIAIISYDTENFKDYYWVEVSPPIEKYFKKIHKYPIQNDIAKELIGAKIVELDSDGFHYTRTLGPDEELARKCMFGFHSIEEYNKALAPGRDYDAFCKRVLSEKYDADWAKGLIIDMDELYSYYDLGELLPDWRLDLERAKDILSNGSYSIDYVSLADQILKLPDLKPHKVSA